MVYTKQEARVATAAFDTIFLPETIPGDQLKKMANDLQQYIENSGLQEWEDSR